MTDSPHSQQPTPPPPGQPWPGAQPPQGPPPPGPPPYGYGYGYPRPMAPQDERTWAMLAHLAPFAGSVVGLPFVGPLVIFLVYKDRGPFVRRQSAESLNFQLTLLIGYVISVALMFVLVGFLTAAILWVGGIVFQIIAAVAANRGEDFRYPMTIRFVS